MWDNLFAGPPVTAGIVIAMFVVAGAVIAVYKWLTGGFDDADGRATQAIGASEARITAAIAAIRQEIKAQAEKLSLLERKLVGEYLPRSGLREALDQLKEIFTVRFDSLEDKIASKRSPRVTRVVAGKTKKTSAQQG
jgi:hypothetical protein